MVVEPNRVILLRRLVAYGQVEFMYAHYMGSEHWQLHEPVTRRGVTTETVEEFKASALEWHEATIAGGDYYHRMARPFPGEVDGSRWYPQAAMTYAKEWRASTTGLNALLGAMRRLFLVVEPAPSNAATFGHEIRQLLILACTSVEAACKAILLANGYAGPTKKWNMWDYRKVVTAQRLTEWKLRLGLYPSYQELCPFADTNADGNFQWYTAYNATKHDGAEFDRATLHHAVSSVAAAFVMHIAQFGPIFPTRSSDVDDFEIVGEPEWPLAGQYVPAEYRDRSGGWPRPPGVAQEYPF